MLLRQRPQLALLSLAQALYWSCSIIGIALTGLVGQKLTPWPLLATLPLTLLVAGNLLAVGTLARWTQQIGRARALQRGALLGVAAGLLAAAALATSSFGLFCLAMLMLGGYQASSGFYRFAALDGVPAEQKGSAAAWVLAGGILAALLAPSLALHTTHWLQTPMQGAYLAIAVLAAIAWLLLHGLPPAATGKATSAQTTLTSSLSEQRRALWARPAIRQAIVLTACAHGLMILAMNATPLAMHAQGHELAHSTQVIQWHVLGMFLPSLIAGRAIDKLGCQKIACLGLALLLASALWALSGVAVAQFLYSSLLLGAGWNLLMLAGTTMLSQACATHEQTVAQPLMEWSNSAVAAVMSFSCGVLVQTLGWFAINSAMLLTLIGLAAWLYRNASWRNAST